MMVADLVSGKTVSDIGCDHGHTGIYLVEKGLCEHVISADLREGPLQRAKKHIEEHGLSDAMETRLSDGLKEFKPGETETILISGMGGRLITEILGGNTEAAERAELVLSPQSELDYFLEWLGEHGFKVTESRICFEAGKYYFAFRANYTGRHEKSDLTNTKPEDIYLKYLLYMKRKKERVYEGLKRANNADTAKKLVDTLEEKRRLEDEINSLRKRM